MASELRSPSDDLIAEAITDFLGERCADFDADCYTCQAWSQYDDLVGNRAELATLRARVEELERERERERERRWCLTCGAVTRDDECDCTEFAENPEAQNLVNYADECARNAREQHLRAEAAESRLAEATRLAVEALEPFADISDLVDSETEGVDDSDQFDLMFHDYLMERFTLFIFRRARTALYRLNAMKGESE